MTSEEKDLLDQIHSQDISLKSREKALSRLGEILEETFILDLLPSKKVIQALEAMSASGTTPPSMKRQSKSLVKAYKI